jgi:hypothetical protein
MEATDDGSLGFYCCCTVRTPPPPPPDSSHTTASGHEQCGDNSDICTVINSILPNGICSCVPTNNGAGFYIICQEDLPLGLGAVGMRLEFEPCDCQAPFAQLSYKIGTDVDSWTTTHRVEADGSPSYVPIPSLSYGAFGHEAGLYATLLLSGDRNAIKIEVGLSLCYVDGSGRECDGSIPGVVGSAVSAAGFPIGVIPFGDDEPPTLNFNGYCSCAPACPGSCTQGMPAFLSGTPLCQMPVLLGAAAAVAVLLACAGFGVYTMRKNSEQARKKGGGDDGGPSSPVRAPGHEMQTIHKPSDISGPVI